MAQVKGKFISLAGALMNHYPTHRAEADKSLFARTGKFWNELEPEEWYDTSIFGLFIEAYAKASPHGENAIVTLGKEVYPTIKASSGLPENLKTPLDFIKFEAEGFMANHRGSDVIPRKFKKLEDKDIIVEAPAPGYNSKLYEGVYLGILEMCNITSGKVTTLRKQEDGAPTSEFHIKW
ncbi:MAG: hypothetical protein HYV28_09495 [Ignavibacteriales bacterium]|nr:hypothetical protein [Ignavibacteriales bacterium]